jgi:hypothetical protein
MTIQYIAPLMRAFARTKRDLFGAFDLKKWFVIGFTAFLAKLTDLGFPGAPSSSWRRRSKVEIDDVMSFPQRAWEWMGTHPGWIIAIGIAVFLVFVIGTILTWLGSRGKFMFLDNVIRSRAEVVKPWYEYRKEGNSLFFWNLGWGIAVLAIVLAYLYYWFLNLRALHQSSGDVRVLIIPAVLAGLGFFAITLAAAFVLIMVRDFLVPIMYRDRITVSKAIQKFLPLFLSEFIHFIAYGLFLLCLWLLIVVGIIVAGCATCCVGFLILAIPYINAVILLPISYAMRAFSVEFLEQFGAGFDIFPRPDAGHPETQPLVG